MKYWCHFPTFSALEPSPPLEPPPPPPPVVSSPVSTPESEVSGRVRYFNKNRIQSSLTVKFIHSLISSKYCRF